MKQMCQCIKFILFWNDTLHVSYGLSIQHQGFKTVHTATCIRQTDTADCLLAGTRWNVSYSWQQTERPSETCSVIPKWNMFDTMVHLVGFTIEIILLKLVFKKWEQDTRTGFIWLYYRNIIIKIGLQKVGTGHTNWIHLAWWQALVNALMNLGVPQNGVSRLAVQIISFCRTQLHEFISLVMGGFTRLSPDLLHKFWTEVSDISSFTILTN